ncbi:MAG: T9SS type A sorting domain-containing protein [Ignavibacteriaceae bacterium]|nr:T9SS type A sorting domain-containing protein [Ignavibacteriaceae bacterium]
MRNILLVLFFFFIVTLLNAYPGGVSGYTKKTNTSGCSCHTSTITSTVLVSIQGPSTLQPSQVGDYTVTVSGGAGTAVGVDIAASGGTLKTSDGNLKVLNNELTQPNKKTFSGGQYVFKYKFTAPATAGKVTLFATACSKKSQWNFAPNFDVTVQTVSALGEEIISANSFQLYQNFPNPFNPSTIISYRLSVSSKVSLTVFDILGNEVATLVNEEKQPGIYEVSFNPQSATNGRQLTSGVYFYQLKAGSFAQGRKMILSK